MCGISGIITKPNYRFEASEVRQMQNSLRHRGPDGKGESLSSQVGLAMRRLSIIDVLGGDQPLYNEDKTIEIIGNGEIYNYIELQKELKRRGHKFRTASDIETAAHAYEEWGQKCVNKFRGQFALAIHDKKGGKVILYRDRMGEKPLYYYKGVNSLFFASEMKALLKIKEIPRDLNWEAIDLYFHYYYIPEPLTAFAGIRKLPPGSILVIDLANWTIEEIKYWNPTEILPKEKGDPTQKIKKVFAQACELTLRSDVPVGISLSGGIDSGSILAFSAPKYKGRMKAFSIGYEGTPSSDERQMAKELAEKFKVEFIEMEIKKSSVVNYFPQLVWNGDDPIADIAGYSVFSVSVLARQHGIKVLLGGVGGDELFWGYPASIAATQKNVKEFSGRFSRLFRKTFHYANPNPKSTGAFVTKLYSKNFYQNLGSGNSGDHLAPPKFKSRLGIAKASMGLVRDLWLTSDVIPLADRMSMASSVELRSPFLDYKFIETVLSSERAIEAYQKEPKYYFKLAMMGVLPKEVLERPKRGFTPPVASWISGILKKYSHLLKNGFLTEYEILDPRKVRLVSSLFKSIPTYSAYQMLLLEIWGREYVMGEDPNKIR